MESCKLVHASPEPTPPSLVLGWHLEHRAASGSRGPTAELCSPRAAPIGGGGHLGTGFGTGCGNRGAQTHLHPRNDARSS